MLTSKDRAELRARANVIETTLIVGRDGVTEMVLAEADNLLVARELVKGRVLESALMSPREVCDIICRATGAEPVLCIGSKFVIYRFSEKCQWERNQLGRARRRQPPVSMADPVRRGVHVRREAERQRKEQRNAYFREQAIERSVQRDRDIPQNRELPGGAGAAQNRGIQQGRGAAQGRGIQQSRNARQAGGAPQSRSIRQGTVARQGGGNRRGGGNPHGGR